MPKYTKAIILVYIFITILCLNFMIFGENQQAYLAYSFLKGSTSLVEIPESISDFAYFNGKFYWPLGPVPAILLMPFVWLFKLNFQESFIRFPLTILNFWLVYQIAKTLKLATTQAIWLAIFFIFGTIYTPVAGVPFSTYFSQVVATTALLLAITESLTKCRPWRMAVFVSLATLTRPTIVLAAFFFIPLILKRFNFTKILGFILIIISSLVILGFYNHARFGKFLESGYSHQVIVDESIPRRNYGLLSLVHVPANLYYMLLKTPDPVFDDNSHVLKFPFIRFDPYGMSIFILSPLLFLVFKANFRVQLVKTSLYTIIIISLPLLIYYGIGYRQIGYRYALDFFPFLLIILVSAIKKVSQKTLIILTLLSVFITWFFTLEMLLGF